MPKKILRPLLSPLSLIDKDLGRIALQVTAIVATTIPGYGPLIAAGLTLAGNYAFAEKPAAAKVSNIERLELSSEASPPRKFAFGTGALNSDILYSEPEGTDQEWVSYIIHLASHRITSVDELYLGEKLAWTSAGGAQGEFAGYLEFAAILEGGPAAYHTVGDGTRWGADQRMTGCATAKLRIKRTGNGKKGESPFANGLSSRVAINGKGMPLYDPRFDSTVPGGDGPMRIDDQDTWAFDVDGYEIGNNPVLQAIPVHIGWRINGTVSVGLGMAPERIDKEAFAVAATECDEPIALAAGGTQRRYQAAGCFSDDDDPRSIQQALCEATNGWFDDPRGKLGFFVSVNDLAGSLIHLTESDVLSGAKWVPFPDTTFNVVRGRNPDPAPPTLYAMTDYVPARLDSMDGQDRSLTLDLPMVQNKPQAQRTAAQVLQRLQYLGEFTATFGARAWQLYRGQPVKFSFSPLGWSELKFRVKSWRLDPATGNVVMTLRIEDESIYAWDAADTAPVTPATPVAFDPLNAPLIQAAAEARALAEDAERRTIRDLDQLGQLAMRLDLEASRTRAIFRDAGFIIDPSAGTVQIYAVQRQGERLQTAEINLSAAQAAINLRATYNYVDEQIALAVLDPSQIAELEPILARLTTAEADISALEGAVALKASTATVTALDTRVSTAEQALAALGDTASLITSLSVNRYAREQDALTDLRNVLNANSAKKAALLASASVRSEVYAKIVSDVAAEAAARQALAVQVAGKASAGAVSALETRVDTAEGQISSQATALIEVETEVGLADATATLALSTANGNEAVAALSADVDGFIVSMTLNGSDGTIKFRADYFEVRDIAGNLMLGLSSGDYVFGGDVAGTVGGVSAAEVAAAAQTGAPRSETIGMGASTELVFVLPAGASRSPIAEFSALELDGGSTITLKLQVAVDNGSFSDLDSDDGTGGVGEPVTGLFVASTYTNTSGAQQVVRFRTLVSATPAVTVTVAPASYISA